MSGLEPVENLGRARATLALMLLSVFFFSASPALGFEAKAEKIPIPGIERSYNPEINRLFEQYKKDSAPAKEHRVDPDLRSLGKGPDMIIHKETTEHENTKPGCESNSSDPHCRIDEFNRRALGSEDARKAWITTHPKQ
jgi:hypothetical protein